LAFDAALTSVAGGTVRIVDWYDDEYGFSDRRVDTIAHIGNSCDGRKHVVNASG
jgi:glyceraldehyde 3-phosphate dehydrogenase